MVHPKEHTQPSPQMGLHHLQLPTQLFHYPWWGSIKIYLKSRTRHYSCSKDAADFHLSKIKLVQTRPTHPGPECLSSSVQGQLLNRPKLNYFLYSLNSSSPESSSSSSQTSLIFPLLFSLLWARDPALPILSSFLSSYKLSSSVSVSIYKIELTSPRTDRALNADIEFLNATLPNPGLERNLCIHICCIYCVNIK